MPFSAGLPHVPAAAAPLLILGLSALLLSTVIVVSGERFDEFVGTLDAETTVVVDRHGDPNLSGVIPDEVGDLTGLERLLIHRTKVSGSIPAALNKLSATLRHVHVGLTKVSGFLPSTLTQLPNLQQLWLYHTALSGKLPLRMGNMAELTNVLLEETNISGLVPESTSVLEKMETFWLRHTKVSGTIPSGMAEMTSLQSVDFHCS